MHRLLRLSCFVIFWLFTIAVKQHFLTFCCFAIRRRRSRAGIMGRKWILGRSEEEKTDFLLLFKCAIYKKNRIYWPLTLSWNTFIVSFKHIQPTSQFFKYFFCSVVQFLVCLDLTACVSFSSRNFFGCSDIAMFLATTTHTIVPRCNLEGRGKACYSWLSARG